MKNNVCHVKPFGTPEQAMCMYMMVYWSLQLWLCSFPMWNNIDTEA